MRRGFDLDHVGLAVRDVSGPMRALIGDWGAMLVSGGGAAGFRAVQIRLGDRHSGMTVELLEPANVERSDFLARFLDRHGDGPHHLTFKVPDLAAELERLKNLGFSPIGVDLSDSFWKEAFLLPREGHGTVVQIAESEFWNLESAWEPAVAGHPLGDGWWPAPPDRGRTRAVLERVVIGAPVVEETAGFFLEVLGGEVSGRGNGWVEIAWPGGGRIMVEAGTPPGIRRLELSGVQPGEWTVAGARFLSRGV